MERIFIGIPLDLDYSEQIIKLTKSLDNNTWTSTLEDNLHLTVLFVGDVYPEIIPSIEVILENISKSTRPFSFLGGRGMIMRPDQPTMFWIKFDRNKYYENLVNELKKYLKKIGTWEKKNLSDKLLIPHITLARIKGGGMFDSLIPPLHINEKLDSFTARKLVLYKVERGINTDSNKYQVIREFYFEKK